MLHKTGVDYPIVVVFTGMTAGILAFNRQWEGFILACSMLALQTTTSRLAHAVLGTVLGLASCAWAPGWIDVPDGPHMLSGRVVSTEFRSGGLRMILDHIVLDGKGRRGKAQIGLYDSFVPLGSGARISCKVLVSNPRGYGNDGEFDYRMHLLTNGVVLTGTVKRGGGLLVQGNPGHHGIRESMIDDLDRLARPEAELLKAMIIGDRSGVTNQIKDRFDSLGISHLLAISGLHIGIAVMLGYAAAYTLLRPVALLVKGLDTPYYARIAGTASAVVYTMFVGAGVTVMRACVMAVSITVCVFFLKRKTDILEGLAFSGVVILLFSPMALFGASFLLSYSAVLGIAAVMGVTAGLPSWLRATLVTPAAGVFTLPLMVYFFGFVSGVGFLANLLIVPVFSVFIMPVSLVGTFLHVVNPYLGSLPLGAALASIRWLLKAGDLFGALHPVPRPWTSWVCACYGGLVLAFWGRPTRARTVMLAALCSAVFTLPVIKGAIRDAAPLQFDFISVGQGDCILVTHGGHAMLIDGGPASYTFDSGRHIVAPHLLARGYTSCDVLVITHLHPDHTGGVPFILRRMPVGQVWVNAVLKDNPCCQEIAEITKEKSIPLRLVQRGDRYLLGPVPVEVLNPLTRLDDIERRLDQNMQSIVLMIGDAGNRGLFMGDADMFAELIQVHLLKDIRAQVLKVAHHGGRWSCLDPFLDAVRPEVAVISCGRRNPHGDPSQDALGRLSDHKAMICRTDLNGEVTVRLFPSRISIKSHWNTADMH
jgi:competence protein ComEC